MAGHENVGRRNARERNGPEIKNSQHACVSGKRPE
jgi:hypothetical protein